MKEISKEKFIENLYIKCDKCGYNNERERFKAFGCCLRCGYIMDDRTYFKATLSKMARHTPRSRGKGKTKAILYF